MALLETSTKILAIAALWAAAICFGIVVIRRWRARELSRRRAWAEEDAIDAAQEIDVEELASHGWLRRWLYLAGYRRISAPSMFISTTAAFGLLGIVIATIVVQTGLTDSAVAAASEVPGGIADLARPILQGA